LFSFDTLADKYAALYREIMQVRASVQPEELLPHERAVA
jgi:hypothetical protein